MCAWMDGWMDGLMDGWMWRYSLGTIEVVLLGQVAGNSHALGNLDITILQEGQLAKGSLLLPAHTNTFEQHGCATCCQQVVENTTTTTTATTNTHGRPIRGLVPVHRVASICCDNHREMSASLDAKVVESSHFDDDEK